MPFNLLLPPLLGGYLFITRFYGTAYRCSGYSGYRLILSASVVGLAFLLVAACILRLLERSNESVFLHHVLIAPSTFGLLLLMYGSFRMKRANRKPSERYDTDREGEYENRENARRSTYRTARRLLAVSIVASSLLAIHSIWGLKLLQVPSFLITAAVAVGLTVLAINVIKAYSGLRGYEVYFRLGVIVLAATVLFMLSLLGQEIIAFAWGAVVPFDNAGVSMLAFLLGASLWYPANYLFPYEAAVGRLVESGEVNGLEQLFHYASVTFQQVLVSLSNDKVYIGYVDDEIAIKGRTDDFVKIVPTASGYRDSTDKTLVITTLYVEPFEKARERGADLSAAELAKIFPIDQIRSAGIFDTVLYEQFGEEYEDAGGS